MTRTSPLRSDLCQEHVNADRFRHQDQDSLTLLNLEQEALNHEKMKLIQKVSQVLFLLASVVVADATSGRAITIKAWPLTSAQPQSLAQVSYDLNNKRSRISEYTPPTGPFTDEDLVRVGFHSSVDSKWQGVVTSAASFDPKYQQKLLLHLDEEGNVWHVAVSTIPKPKPKKGKMVQGKRQPPEEAPQIVVEVLSPVPAPTPILNKPVVLSPEGKLEEKPVEKTFLQK